MDRKSLGVYSFPMMEATPRIPSPTVTLVSGATQHRSPMWESVAPWNRPFDRTLQVFSGSGWGVVCSGSGHVMWWLQLSGVNGFNVDIGVIDLSQCFHCLLHGIADAVCLV